MKTPEEIKKGLGNCADSKNDYCTGCPYDVREGEENCAVCIAMMARDALDYIHQLEAALDDEKNKNEILIFDNDKLMEEIAQAERERDAAVNDIEPNCDYCEFTNNAYGEAPCPTQEELAIDGLCLGFKWRGVCQENTKEETR